MISHLMENGLLKTNQRYRQVLNKFPLLWKIVFMMIKKKNGWLEPPALDTKALDPDNHNELEAIKKLLGARRNSFTLN